MKSNVSPGNILSVTFCGQKFKVRMQGIKTFEQDDIAMAPVLIPNPASCTVKTLFPKIMPTTCFLF